MIGDIFLKSIIFGGIDGIISTFNVISASAGLKLNLYYVLIIGLTSLIADGMSMGIGDYLSYDAQKKLEKENYEMHQQKPLYHGLVTFGSFLIFGMIPLTLFFIVNKYYKGNMYSLLLACMTVAFFLLGAFQSIYTKEQWWYSGARTAIFGDVTSILAYLVSDKLLVMLKK